MNKLAVVLSLTALWCFAIKHAACGQSASVQHASAVSARAPHELSIATKGEPYDIRIDGHTLTYCDERGRRTLNIDSGRHEGAGPIACATKEQPNTACDGLVLEVIVRAPPTPSNDIVDVGGASFPLKGRVHDCAADHNTLAIVTGSSVVLIEVAKRARTEINRQGGDRVTIGSGWIAWTLGSNVRARAYDVNSK